MDRAYFVIDVFTADPFAGNPAAVVLDTNGLDNATMQAIAAEFNLSETTFILPPTEADPAHDSAPADLTVRFRWFTPTMEVGICGHATIAGVRALAECGRLRQPEIAQSVVVRIETCSAWLTAFVERVPNSDTELMIWLDLVDPILTERRLDPAKLETTLNVSADRFDRFMPVVETQDHDVLVFVKDVEALNGARPDFTRLAEFMRVEGLRGLSLATTGTLTPSIHVQSRFFAPAAGVDEDPVTGSVHGPLAAFLVKQGVVQLHADLAAVTCVQSKAGGRAGLLHALVQRNGVDSFSVRIGGRTVTSMAGTLRVG